MEFTAVIHPMQAGAIGVLTLVAGAGIRFPGTTPEDSRWFFVAWAMSALPILFVQDWLLQLAITLAWVSPVASWIRVGSITWPIATHIHMCECGRGYGSLTSLLKEFSVPSLLAFQGGVLMLVALVAAIHAGWAWWIGVALLVVAMSDAALGVVEKISAKYRSWLDAERGPNIYIGLTGLSLSNPVHLAGALVLATPIALSLSGPAFWVVVAGIGAAVAATTTKMPLAAFAAVVAGWVGMRSPILGLGLALAGLAAPFALNAAVRRWNKRHGTSPAKKLGTWGYFKSVCSNDRRPRLWRIVLHYIRQAPITGVGMGAYWETAGKRFQQEARRWEQAHNEWLQVAMECGIPCALLFGAWWVWATVGAFWDGRVQTGVGLLGLAMLSMTEYPVRYAGTAPYALYYVARSIAHV